MWKIQKTVEVVRSDGSTTHFAILWRGGGYIQVLQPNNYLDSVQLKQRSDNQTV